MTAANDKYTETGYDITEDSDDPRAVCCGCATTDEQRSGEPLHKGDVWSGHDSARCCRCGADLGLRAI